MLLSCDLFRAFVDAPPNAAASGADASGTAESLPSAALATTATAAAAAALLRKSSGDVGAKTRALAAAATAVLRNAIEVGVCANAACPNCFSAADAGALLSGGSDSATALQPRLRRPRAESGATCLSTETFDAGRAGLALASSPAQLSRPLCGFVADVLTACSSAASPVHCAPETFACALVLVDRLQHNNIAKHQQRLASRLRLPIAMVLASAAADSDDDDVGDGDEKKCCQPLPLPPRAPTGAEVAGGVAARVRAYIDGTSTAQQLLLLQQQQQQHSSSASPPAATPSSSGVCAAATSPQPQAPKAAVSRDGDEGVTDTQPSLQQPNAIALPTAAAAAAEAAAQRPGAAAAERARDGPCEEGDGVCDDCRAAGVFALHAGNVHLFLAAALLVSIKAREDLQPQSQSRRRLLADVAAALRCTSNAELCAAERCLCAAVDFDIGVRVDEYRMMLRRLHLAAVAGSGKGEAAGAVGGDAGCPPESFMSVFPVV